jgi:predicted amidohydrolase
LKVAATRDNRRVRVLLAAMTCEKGDVDANLAVHVEKIARAVRAECSLIVFPEFSLTGSVDPIRAPADAITIDDPAIAALVAATGPGVAAVFGFAQRCGDQFFITQAVASDGVLCGWQRKRHLGEDETAYATGSDACVFEVGARRLGIVICAEGDVEWTWNATVAAGAEIVLFCSAPGLYGRRTDEASMRAGFEWWSEHGLGGATRNAKRLNVPVAMATQAGATVDEDFPGLAALVSARGKVVQQTSDWNPADLIVKIPERPVGGAARQIIGQG